MPEKRWKMGENKRGKMVLLDKDEKF